MTDQFDLRFLTFKRQVPTWPVARGTTPRARSVYVPHIYIIYIYTNVLHRTGMECSRDSCRRTCDIDCFSAMILGTVSPTVCTSDPLSRPVRIKGGGKRFFFPLAKKKKLASDVISRLPAQPSIRPASVCCVHVLERRLRLPMAVHVYNEIT